MERYPYDCDVQSRELRIMDPWTVWCQMWLALWFPPMRGSQAPAVAPTPPDNVIWVDFRQARQTTRRRAAP